MGYLRLDTTSRDTATIEPANAAGKTSLERKTLRGWRANEVAKYLTVRIYLKPCPPNTSPSS
jgi:hypothetical protein